MYLLASLVASVAFAETNVNCTNDTGCSFRCCTYTEINVVNGTCVEISEFARCADRKRNYHIGLYTFLALLIATACICGWIKKKENSSRRMALQ